MSEIDQDKDVDNNTNNNEKTVIESEVVESDNAEPTIDRPVAKKGSFMGFLAFVFSVAALGLSGYMYYVDHYIATNIQENNQDNDGLKSSISTLENKSNQLSQLLTSTQQNNQKLGVQLNAVQEQVKEISAMQSQDLGTTINSTPDTIVEAYDDSEINQKIAELQNKIAVQNQIVQELQNKLNSNNTKNSLSIEKLSADIQSNISNQSNSLPVVTQANQTKAIAGSLLHEAYVQLNINGNIAKAQDLLDQAISQLSELTGLRYSRLASELETLSQQLTNIEQTDIESIKSQIIQLSESTNNLEFVQSEATQKKNKDSSWFDHLITIKKIDENQQPRLSKSQQITIGNVISNHYQMLQLALISSNQGLWLSEIEQLQYLLSSHFADNANDIKQQLTELATIDLSPQLPNLSPYLQQFKSINLANENE